MRASSPRTIPLGVFALWLSWMDEPTTITPFTTATGERTAYSVMLAGLRRPARSSTVPPDPKTAHGLPSAASRAIKRASVVPT